MTTPHKCALLQSNPQLEKTTWFNRLFLVSEDNPLRFSIFSSNISIRKEQLRHLQTGKYIIHPFSRLKAWYDMYLIYLYSSLLFTKPLDAAFVKMDIQYNPMAYIYYTAFTDVLSWIDIGITFITGYEVPDSKLIELEPSKIALHYVLGPYFITDLLSGIPKWAFHHVPNEPVKRTLFGIMHLLGLTKLMRVNSLLDCVKRTVDYFRFVSKNTIFLIRLILGAIVAMHWFACMQFAIPRQVRRYMSQVKQEVSWYFVEGLETSPWFIRYCRGLLKSAAYTLGMRLNFRETTSLPEELLLAIATYLTGKILIAFIWITLALTILNYRLMDIKFSEIMNELNEYMTQKQLPLHLRKRIEDYFVYKYRCKYFKEELVTSLLSSTLKREANLYLCKNLIKNVSLFCELTPDEIQYVVEYLIPEIYLPNDVIVQSGTVGDYMFFLGSGTVAMYTRSGKEIGHLQDGAYFGEVCLIMRNQLRFMTVVAIESSQVYKLSKKNLDKCLLNNKDVKKKLIDHAEQRMREVAKAEEEYKNILLQRSLKF